MNKRLCVRCKGEIDVFPLEDMPKVDVMNDVIFIYRTMCSGCRLQYVDLETSDLEKELADLRRVRDHLT